MHKPELDRARRDRRRAGFRAHTGTIAFLTAMMGSGPAALASITQHHLPTLRPITIELNDYESVGNFLRTRDGSFINSGDLVYIGPGTAVQAVSWDVEIERIDPITLYSEVGIGLLDLSAGPFISLPDDAPSFGLGGTPDWQSTQGSFWVEHVTGVIDLTRGIDGHRRDLSVRADADGMIYFEVFESWDDDDDRGVTTANSHLGVDALVNGTVTFWVNPSPGPLSVLATGLMVVGRRKRGSIERG